ncbi:hypothetical protein E3N88_12904 [Mikania micrantha]|uniref:Chromo domain-containing protein n=1 Tax=Mikania micrantha TaxID=192012 RepID=A0A5N6P6W9_9ASTR|nr:hypothetical protein E3N88_12904 [Mikania micrantha]
MFKPHRGFINLPASSQVHPTFHVSLLKKAIGPPTCVTPIPSGPSSVLQPFKILERKLARKGNRAVVKFLVQWKDLPLNDASWPQQKCEQREFENGVASGRKRLEDDVIRITSGEAIEGVQSTETE